MQEVYNYKTLAEWLTIHKNRVDEIMQRDGFCAGFRYDLAVRTNAFQCDTFSDGKIVFPNISLHRPTIKQQTYSEARAKDELCFLDNPYVPGGQQEEYDPHTGCLKTNQSKKQNTNTRLGGQNQNGRTNSFRRDSYRSPRNRDDRDSSPDQNRQENNPRGQNGDDRRGNRNRNRNQDSRARDRACNHSAPQGQSSPKEGQRTPQRNKPRVPPPPLSPHGPSFEPQAATPDRETLQVTQAEPRAATWPSGVSCEMNSTPPPPSIAWLETVAVRIGLLLLINLGVALGRRFIVWTDNNTTLNANKKRSSRNQQVNKEWGVIQDILLAEQIDLSPRRVESAQNTADGLSRGLLGDCSPSMRLPLPLPEDLLPLFIQT
ncbi:hypothetical protein PCASD_04062 [Puccinia coronata f. sp. avenae]|uniref:Uncharacterized protein n=1 Tax=Puccinia coronata f. sp. avenae TaxID=200324 RepID=A0A2N5VCB4_9BASI|nr:hypothetical protein PCASD_04062 [Puccinia coronata f. sp. avenae]